MSDFLRPMSHTRDDAERRMDADDVKRENDDPREATPSLGNAEPPISQGPPGGLHYSTACQSDDHRSELAMRGIPWLTRHCLVCAVESACTVEVNDVRRIVRDDTDAIKAWAYDVGSVHERDCANLAECAADHPEVFLKRYRYAGMVRQREMLERARQELRGAYATLYDIRTDFRQSFEDTALTDAAEVVQQQLASALALLEERGR